MEEKYKKIKEDLRNVIWSDELKLNDWKSKLRQIEYKEEQETEIFIKDNFVLTNDHKKLLSKAIWIFYGFNGDNAVLGINHKRPFGNSDFYRDVIEILGWKNVYSDEDGEIKPEIIAKVERILRELPLAMTEIFNQLEGSEGEG